jgi:hypothetical protein
LAPSQANCYQRLAQDLRQAVLAALHDGSRRLLGTYLQALLAYPDACTSGETVLDPASGRVIAHAPALPAGRLYPKEQALVELIHHERARGRRVLVYLTHTETRDLSPRLRSVLEHMGFGVAVLKASTVAADRREEWVAARVREGADVLLCHPRLVQTGLDLIDWPSIVWYQTEYSVYVMRQASRRSWRIGQRQPVEVTYLVYEGTLQAEALTLVAAKLRSALLVEGELPEEGLAALDGDGQDVCLALARRLADQSAAGQSLEALFAQTRGNEAEVDDYLVAGGWTTQDTSTLVPIGQRHDPEDAAGALWSQTIPGMPLAQSSIINRTAPGRTVSFEELADLVRRPKPRRTSAPDEQLPLFAG